MSRVRLRTESTGAPSTATGSRWVETKVRPTIAEMIAFDERPSIGAVRTRRPSRSTVTRSASATTSSMRCEVKMIATPAAASWRTTLAIISAMVGRNFIPTHRELMAVEGAPVLSVRDLTLDTVGPRGWRRVLHGVSFDLRRGEILGIGGLLGSGRTEIVESIFGAARGWRGGEIAIDGKLVVINSPTDACALGIALVTEDRKARGLLLASTVRDNIALPSVGPLSRFALRDFVREAALAAEVVEG